MGQRLNLEIRTIENVQLNVYYHWSGFTESAISKGLGLINSNARTFKQVFEYLETTGAGLVAFNEEEANELLQRHDITPTNIDPSRNDGLIGIDNEAIRQTRFWEEQRLELDFCNDQYGAEKIFWKRTEVSNILYYHDKVPTLKHLLFYGKIHEFEQFAKDVNTPNHMFITFDELYMWVE